MTYGIRNEKSEPFLWVASYRKPYSAKLEDLRKGKVIDQIFRNRKDCMECHQRHLNNNPYVGVLPNQNTLPENKAYKATDLTKPKRNRWGRRITPKGLQTVYMTLTQEKTGYKQSLYFYGLDPSQPVEIETRDFTDEKYQRQQTHNFVIPSMKLSLQDTIVKTMREQQPNTKVNMNMVSELVKALSIGAK
tara:strand:- start:119 stop:688 length:570 start_codon:yes stop_codon:yes gene_type:complete